MEENNQAKEAEVRAQEANSAGNSAKANTETAKRPSAPKPIRGARDTQAFFKELDDLARLIGILAGGVEYLIESKAPDTFIQEYFRLTDQRLADTIADGFGYGEEDKERILDPEKRTEEEKQLFKKGALLRAAHGTKLVISSDYLVSFGIIGKAVSTAMGVDYDSLYDDQEGNASLIDAITVLNRYFYIELHKELNPLAKGFINDPEKAELQKLAQDFATFHQSQQKEPAQSVIDFIIPPVMGDITELAAQTDTTFLPLSLVWRDQINIGKQGNKGVTENVGKRTEDGAVEVSVYISDKNGKEITIDAVMQGVQAAIGQLIDDNGRQLPLIVTPQQVYRAYARLPNDANVTSQQAAEMERAIDALMFSPAHVDFREQLDKHKNIKQQPDYDYTAKNQNRGVLTGNLITAEKGEGINRKGERQVAYKIYSFPILYRYSHIIGQIAQVQNKLITGDEKKPTKDDQKIEAQRNALNIGIRRNVLTRITYMKSRLKKRQSINAALMIEEIADDCNIKLSKKTEELLRRNIRQYLDELQSQREIKKYQIQKDGRHIVGFYIRF